MFLRRTGRRPPRAEIGWQRAFALLLIIILAVVPAQGDFVTFKGDLERSGNISDDGPAFPNLLWEESLTPSGSIYGGAVVSDGKVYVSSWQDMSLKGEHAIGCFDAQNGTLLWLSGTGGASTPSISGDMIYAGSAKGDLYSLDAATGKILWNRTLERNPEWWGLASSPLVMEGEIFSTSFSDGALHILDLGGEELWNLSTGRTEYRASPAGAGGRVYFAGGDPALYCLDSSSRTVLWKFETEGPITTTPAVGEGLVFFATEGIIQAVNATSGVEAWSAEMKGTISSPAVSHGRVYVGTDDSALNCYDTSDGSLLWSKEVNGPVLSSPVVAGYLVYFGTNVGEGTVFALDAETGDLIWSHLIGDYVMSSPAVDDGVLYIGSDDGKFRAFGPGPSKTEEPSDLIWDGVVVLTGGEINISSGSGHRSVPERSALGALIKASEAGGFELELDTSLWDIRGPVAKSIGGVAATENGTWRYVVNYPRDPVPLVGPDQFLLKEGDKITFFLGDRHALPDESPRVNMTAGILIERPEALFIAAENHVVIEESSKDAVLNVTLTFAETAPSNFSGYDLIFLEMVGSDGATKLLPLLEAPKEAGVPVISIHSEGYDALLGNVDLEDHPDVEDYWNYGGVENMEGLYSYLARAFLGLEVPVMAPVPTPRAYICHPDSPDLFLNTTSYLQWYRNHSGRRYDEGAPTIGVMNLADDPVTSSMRIAIIRTLESKGANVIDIGFENTTTIKDFFILNGSTIVDAVILTKPFRLNYGDPEEGIEDLLELNVPVLNAMKLWYQTPEEWGNSTGLFPTELYFKIAMPEMDAIIEPITIAGRTEKGTFDPVQSQIEWLADRTIAWAELGRRPNSEKRAAIIYYNHGGGKDNLGATYINVPRSLQVILDGLNDSGYRVEGTVPDERDLVDLMAHEGTNVGTWAPGELERMVEAGNATLIPVDDYLEWFSEIDPAKQEEVTEMWGPAPGEIMVYENETGRYFVIPKLSFGNVILAPQPTRGWLQNSTILYHNKDIPPHHQYIAFYLWLRRGFDADFIVHLGKHGTQEWTPGKESGISRDQCWPGILIQDLPVIYPYIVDNIAEGSQAKRRGDAVIITHLTPPIVASGLYGNFTNLAETAFNYHQVENASVKALYREEIIARCEEMHLDEDLDKNLSKLAGDPEAFDGFVDELEHYLYDLKNEFMPYGLHTFATPPEGRARLEMVQSMLGDDFRREVALMISYQDYPNPSRLDKERELDNTTLGLLAAVIDNGTSPDLAQGEIFSNRTGAGTANRSENLTALLTLALSRSEGLDASVEEVPRFINASESEYTPPSPADDPIRDPNVLPTGRNFHSISPRMVPTPAAWVVGSALAEDMIEVYQAEHNGTYPRKLAIVLWAWATTDHGVVEAEILKLVGAEPVWDSYGGVSDVRLTPLSELGRPRVDVVVVPSGLHRDLFPEKLQLIDRAIRLAANDSATDYPNYVRENAGMIRSELLASGNYSEEDADFLSASRIFLEAAGTYGPNLDSPVSASDTWENDSKLGDLFIDRMSYIYGDEVWGSRTPSGKDYAAVQTEVYRRNLAEVEAAVHHTNSNLYGFADNDDVYQYMGGIAMAVRTVTGETPDLYVTDARAKGDRGKVEPLKSFFTRELRSRYYNPKWIEGMKGQGYSGAREMDKFAEYLWGWDVTVPDLVTETMWNEVYDVYVNDKYDLGLQEFFDENNPYAYQVITARMLEASRKDYWHPAEEIKQHLAEEFDKSETEFGVTCCHHTCGNILLREYMEGVLTGTEPTEASSNSNPSKGGSSSHPYPQERPASGTANQTKTSGVGVTSTEKPVESESVEGEVSGFVMENVMERSSMPSISGAPLMGIILVLFILLAMGAGFRRS